MGNVVSLVSFDNVATNRKEMADVLRKVAEQIEAGKFHEVGSCVIVLHAPGHGCEVVPVGAHALTTYGVIGLLEMAKMDYFGSMPTVDGDD